MEIETIYFTQCEPTWSLDTDRNWMLLKMILLYAVPLIFMTVAYCQIIRVLWKSGNVHQHSLGKYTITSFFLNYVKIIVLRHCEAFVGIHSCREIVKSSAHHFRYTRNAINHFEKLDGHITSKFTGVHWRINYFLPPPSKTVISGTLLRHDFLLIWIRIVRDLLGLLFGRNVLLLNFAYCNRLNVLLSVN